MQRLGRGLRPASVEYKRTHTEVLIRISLYGKYKEMSIYLSWYIRPYSRLNESVHDVHIYWPKHPSPPPPPPYLPNIVYPLPHFHPLAHKQRRQLKFFNHGWPPFYINRQSINSLSLQQISQKKKLKNSHKFSQHVLGVRGRTPTE